MQRHCVCGKCISYGRHLCDECSNKYGSRATWPKWLIFHVNDLEREYRQELQAENIEVPLSDEN